MPRCHSRNRSAPPGGTRWMMTDDAAEARTSTVRPFRVPPTVDETPDQERLLASPDLAKDGVVDVQGAIGGGEAGRGRGRSGDGLGPRRPTPSVIHLVLAVVILLP